MMKWLLLRLPLLLLSQIQNDALWMPLVVYFAFTSSFSHSEQASDTVQMDFLFLRPVMGMETERHA